MRVYRQPNFIEGDNIDLVFTYEQNGREKIFFKTGLYYIKYSSDYAKALALVYPTITFEKETFFDGGAENKEHLMYILVHSDFLRSEFESIGACMRENIGGINSALATARVIELEPNLREFTGSFRLGSLIYEIQEPSSAGGPYAELHKLNVDGDFFYTSGNRFGYVDSQGQIFAWGEPVGDVFTGITLDLSLISEADMMSIKFSKNKAGEDLPTYVDRLRVELAKKGYISSQ